MLDLAAALLEAKQHDIAERIIHRANQRLAMYLVEQENKCLKVVDNDNLIQYQKPISQSSFSMLQAFTVKMRRLERRPMMSNLNKDHPVRSIFHCFLGDTLSVLANCAGLEHIKFDRGVTNDNYKVGSKEAKGRDLTPVVSNQQNLWAIAGEFYRKALSGWIRVYGICHPNVPATSCGLARCLRELNRREEAIIILSSAVSAWNGASPLNKNIPATNHFMKQNKHGKESQRKALELDLATEEVLAMCLWWMAVYFVESSPTERGRIRALSLLQASSESLQLAFKKASSSSYTSLLSHGRGQEIHYETIRLSDLLSIIESEAEELFSFEINDGVDNQRQSEVFKVDPDKLSFVLSSV